MRECICKGKPLHVLTGAWAQRTTKALAASLEAGETVRFADVQLAALLVRKLSEGTKMPHDARYRNLDHHLPDCPCSPRVRAERPPALTP